MAAAFGGRRWNEFGLDELVTHRAWLTAMTAVAYRAYLPAYLAASLLDDEEHVLAIGAYMIHGLIAWPGGERAQTSERLLLLDDRQRGVVAEVLRHLATVWNVRDAWDVLVEWLRPTAERLRQQIETTFAKVVMPDALQDMLMAPFAISEDAGMLAVAIRGKPWREITEAELFFHRESLSMLSAAAYRACLPACLLACLDANDDLRQYVLFGLNPCHEEGRGRMRERLSLLAPAELVTLRDVVAYLAVRYGDTDAKAAASKLGAA
ncbi:MAG: hypothetical protein ABI867_39810 [Kofleriaceae bacterium]